MVRSSLHARPYVADNAAAEPQDFLLPQIIFEILLDLFLPVPGFRLSLEQTRGSGQ